jgi:RND family efflux transporter MFP subunit
MLSSSGNIIYCALRHVFKIHTQNGLSLAVGLLLSGCHEVNAPIQPPRPVRTVIVSSSEMGSPYTQTGEIRPREESAQAFRIDGRLLSRPVDVGSRVKRGDLIATLDPTVSENQLHNAQADLASALSSERLTAVNLRRMKSLVATGAIARSQLDEAQANEDAAISRKDSLLATLANAQEQLAFNRLNAPADGIITVVSGNPGQFVAAGQEVVGMALFSGRDAVFNVPESLIKIDRKGTPVSISLLSDPQVTASGHVRDISPQADPVTRTWRVRVAIDNPPATMPYGATVQGTIRLAGDKAYILPASALTRDGPRPAVFVVTPEKFTLRLQTITLERYGESQIFVASGLHEGDRVVTAGVSKLRPGESISLEENH